MKRNCIVLGSARSGTSMVMGVISKSRFFMGDYVYPPNEGNVKGIFEDKEINGIGV